MENQVITQKKDNYKKKLEISEQEKQFLAQNIEHKEKQIQELQEKIGKNAYLETKVKELEQEKEFLAQNINSKEKKITEIEENEQKLKETIKQQALIIENFEYSTKSFKEQQETTIKTLEEQTKNLEACVSNLKQDKTLLEKTIEENEKKHIEELKKKEKIINDSFEKRIEELKKNINDNYKAQELYIKRREEELNATLNFIENSSKILEGASYIYNYVKNDLINRATKEEKGDKGE